MKIFGIDIIRGSVRSRTRRPVYALVKRDGGAIVSENPASLFRLLRQVAAEEPAILAVDSLQEISVDQHELFSFIQHLPPATRLVQVTGGERLESLAQVASRFNISFNKSDPFSEARTIAHVAELGAGAEVIAFENACDIVVSRHRSLGKGGWSQNRYVRKIHGAVLQRGREIEDALRAEGLSYEKEELKAFGGVSRVRFSVAAPRDSVPVRSYRGPDVQVKITGRRLDRIRFQPLLKRPRHLIVGIDPGTTVGIAAVDLEGNLIHLKSSRQMSMADVIEELYTLGKPLVIASDVAHMPASVEKIRRSFSAVAYTPRADRTQEEKVQICAGHPYKNDHERDSLSGALDAYRQYRKTFRNITKRVPSGVNLDDVRAGVVRGLTIEQALAGAGAPVPVEKEEPEVIAPTVRDERLLQLDGMIKSLRGHVSDLQEELKAKDVEIARLNSVLGYERSQRGEQLKRDAVIERRDVIIKNQKKKLRREDRRRRKLVKQVERLKRFADLQMDSDYIPVKVLPSMTRDGVRALDDDLGIGDGDLLYAARTDGWGSTVVDFLVKAGVRVIITGCPDEGLIDAFRRKGVPLLTVEGVPVQVQGRTGTVLRERLEEALEAWDSQQKIYMRERKEEMLESIVTEYRGVREREVKKHG